MATRSKKRSGRAPAQLPVSSGAWRGVRDNADSGSQSPDFLQDCINGYFPAPEDGCAVYARPGFNKLTGSTGLESSSAVQCLFGVVVSFATYVFAIVNGKVYRQSGAQSWTDVTPVGPTISTTAPRIHALFYNDEVIISDGANRPWRASSLTATPIIGTNIQVNSSSQAWYSTIKPTIHGGKLFFAPHAINSVDTPGRLVWSEEADASIGYMQTGYTNFWDPTQTPTISDYIYAIQGTNDGLFYFRNFSIGVIRGAVNADFTTATTHDGIANSRGISFGATEVCFAENYVWFLDSSNRPCRIRVGSREIEEVWKQMRHRIRKIEQTSGTQYVVHPQLAYAPDLGKIVGFFLQDSSASLFGSRNLYVFDAKTGSYEGRWLIGLQSQPATETPDAVRVRCLGAVQRWESGADPRMLTLLVGGTRGDTTDEGHIWHQSTVRMDLIGDDSQQMHMSITTMLHPDEQNANIIVDLVALDTVPDTTTVSLDYYTPYGSRTGLTATGTASADSIQSSFDHGVVRWGLGPNAQGRSFRAVFHKNVAAGSTPHAFERASYEVRVQRGSPNAP